MRSAESLCNQFHQLSVTIHHVVLHLVGRNFGEELVGLFDLALFDSAQVHAGHGALGFGNKEDMLNLAFLECNGPVGVVVAYRAGWV